MTKSNVPGRSLSPWRVVTAAGVLLVLAPAAAPSVGQSPGPAVGQRLETINWSIRRGGSSADATKVQLTIESRWNSRSRSSWSNDRPIAELQGLDPAQVTGRPGPVRFALVRDAGRLDCSGIAGNLTGSGACSFSPDPAFTAFLQARGIGAPDRQQSFSLAMSRVGRDLVDSMQSIGYARSTIDQLVAMGIHGVSPQFVRGLAQSGYRLKSADDLVAFKIHGVDLDYIRGMAAIGPQFARIPASELVSMRIHGVKPDYVRGMAAMGPGFARLRPSDLVSFQIHGARPEMVRAYARYSGNGLQSSDVVAMAIHGVTGDYIDQLAALGYRNLSGSDLVSMRIHGVTPAFVRSLQQAGLARLSADQLVRLRTTGFDPRSR